MPRQREFDREQVLDRALMVFWAQGYEATSVRDLITAMDISSSSMYEVFGDKRGVFLDVLSRFCAMEQAGIQARAAAAPSARAFVETLFAVVEQVPSAEGRLHGSLTMQTMVEFGTRDPDITRLLLDHYYKIAEVIIDVLATAQADGTLSDAIPAADLAHTILSTVYGAATITSVAPEFAYREAVKNVILSLIPE